MQTSDWILIGTTFILAITAYSAPYIIEIWKYKFYSAKLAFKFFHTPPYSHITEARGVGVSFPIYYFRFKVVNNGKIQAEQCEAVLEKIWIKTDSGELEEYTGFSPVSLNWSSPRAGESLTIQPGREIFCNIGSVQHPDYEPESGYMSITEEEKRLNKFFLSLGEKYFAQRDCLVPGKYQIEVAIYSKNAKKVSKKFKIIWSGTWQDEEIDMLNELVIF